MALPKIQDLITYVSKVITGSDWNTNWQTVVSWLSSGNTDIKVKSIELSASGGITNNGSFTQSGNVNIDGNLAVTGSITGESFTGDGSGLTGIVSAATVAYTPFAINSGNVDSNGKSDILYYTGGTGLLKFKVGGTLPTYNNLVATSAQGVNFELTQILDLNVSTYNDGTYTVCIKKNQTVAEVKGTVYSQITTPTGLNNDLWLNTSVEKLKCYEKIAGSWNNEYEGVPIGTITVASGVITAVTTIRFNYNGYNVNKKNDSFVESTYTNGTTWNRVSSDGWVEQGGRISYGSGGAHTESLTLSVAMSDILSVTLTETSLSGYVTKSYISVLTGSAVTVVSSAGGSGTQAGIFIWKVAGYKA